MQGCESSSTFAAACGTCSPFSIAAIALLVVSLLDRDGGDLVGGLIFLLLGAVATPAGVAAWHLGRAHPALIVDDYGLTVDHPGVLKRPLRLDRSEVHSVYVRSFPGHERSPTFDGTGWERFRQRVRWVDSRGGPQCRLPVSAMDAPDLSVLDVLEDRNLLIVLATSLPMKSLARRGLGSLALAVARGPSYSGPTRATVARIGPAPTPLPATFGTGSTARRSEAVSKCGAAHHPPRSRRAVRSKSRRPVVRNPRDQPQGIWRRPATVQGGALESSDLHACLSLTRRDNDRPDGNLRHDSGPQVPDT